MGRIFGKAVLLFACFLALTGCPVGKTKVFIKQTSYNPSFETANLSAYKGKVLYFSSVTNNAANTSIWDYYSTDSKYAYEASPALQTYFWDCFIKSFNRIGVTTLASPWTRGTRDGAGTPDRPELGLRSEIRLQRDPDHGSGNRRSSRNTRWRRLRPVRRISRNWKREATGWWMTLSRRWSGIPGSGKRS